MAKLGRACALLMLCAVTAIPSIAQTFTVLYSAAPVPEGGLNLDAAGNLYGATAGGCHPVRTAHGMRRSSST
jgi:hypothetical protein